MPCRGFSRAHRLRASARATQPRHHSHRAKRHHDDSHDDPLIHAPHACSSRLRSADRSHRLASPAYAVHAIAQYGEPKYPAGFKHFDYVNPDAPRDGTLVLANPNRLTSFDKFNPFTLRGNPAPGLSLMFESLTTGSSDEVATAYGLLADDISVAPDGMSTTFHINPKARFSNGDPVTAEDVKFSFETLKSPQAAPQFSVYFGQIARAVIVDPLDDPLRVQDRDARDAAARGRHSGVFAQVGHEAGRHAHSLRSARVSEADRQRAVSDRSVRQRPHDLVPAQSGVLGRGAAGAHRHVQFRAHRLQALRRSDRAPRSVQGGRVRRARRVCCPKLGAARYRQALRQRRAHQARVPAAQRHGHAGLLHEHAQAALQGRARASGARSRARFRVAQPATVLQSVQAHRQLFRQYGSASERRAERQASWRY